MAELSKDEKIRLFNGVGNWNSYDAGGKLLLHVKTEYVDEEANTWVSSRE